ncbi:MAG: esterase family protein [Gemmataceae bacterium]
MHRSYHRWYSPSLGRDMELLVFGHAGARVIAFPASMHPFHDWEDRGLVAAIGHQLEHGHFQLFCVDQVDRESWYAWHTHPAQRAARYAQYDRYLADEVVPFTRTFNPHPYLITAGPSFGAYHAVNFALRHPDLVSRALGMSGLYDIKRFAGGFHDGNVYFHNPVDYVPGETDPGRIDALRRLDLILAVGRDDPLLGQNQHLSGLLWSKGVWHALRIWDGFAHDWPVWARMLPLYLGGPD